MSKMEIQVRDKVQLHTKLFCPYCKEELVDYHPTEKKYSDGIHSLHKIYYCECYPFSRQLTKGQKKYLKEHPEEKYHKAKIF
jgi:hypothetical protein